MRSGAPGGRHAQPRTGVEFLSGAGSVGSYVTVAGLSTYLFLSVSARAVGPEHFAPISTLWALVFIVGPGLFLPMQQELGRVLAARRGDRAGGNPVTKALAVSGVLVAVTVIGTGIAGPWLTHELFAGSWAMFGYFELTVLGFALVYVARGVLSGLGEFRDFGRLVLAESLIRLAVGAGLSLSGVHRPGPYGAAIAIAPFVALVGTCVAYALTDDEAVSDVRHTGLASRSRPRPEDHGGVADGVAEPAGLAALADLAAADVHRDLAHDQSSPARLEVAVAT